MIIPVSTYQLHYGEIAESNDRFPVSLPLANLRERERTGWEGERMEEGQPKRKKK